jgi:hypothetical protein
MHLVLSGGGRQRITRERSIIHWWVSGVRFFQRDAKASDRDPCILKFLRQGSWEGKSVMR